MENTKFVANPTLKKAKEARGPGWVATHPRYGQWYISREAVAFDYIISMMEDAREIVSESVIDSWFTDQVSWFEFFTFGVQIKRPDMELVEKQWLKEMEKDVNPSGCWWKPENGDTEVQVAPPAVTQACDNTHPVEQQNALLSQISEKIQEMVAALSTEQSNVADAVERLKQLEASVERLRELNGPANG